MTDWFLLLVLVILLVVVGQIEEQLKKSNAILQNILEEKKHG